MADKIKIKGYEIDQATPNTDLKLKDEDFVNAIALKDLTDAIHKLSLAIRESK